MMTAKSEDFRQSLAKKSNEEIIQIATVLFCEKEDALIKLTEFQNASSEMAIQFQQMKEELLGVRSECKALREQNQHLAGIKTIQSKELFGRGTEKSEDILNQAMKGGSVPSDPLAEDAQESIAENGQPGGEKILFFKHAAGKRKKAAGKRAQDLSRLPVCKVFDYDINTLNREYGEGNWRFAFWRESPTVEVVRQMTYLKITYTPVISVGLEHSLARIPYENALIPKSIVSPSLLAQIITDKYSLFLPLYRQEHDPGRFGFPLSRQTMSNWILFACHELLLPVYESMCTQLRTFTYQQCDETTYTVIHDGRNAGTKSFIWVHRTSELLEEPAIIVYCYELTRGADHLRNFYADQTEPFFLTCDAFSAYPSFAKESEGSVMLCGCFMHARRRFVDALSVLSPRGLTEEQLRQLPEVKGITLIGEIYHADEPLKVLSAAERQEKRQTDVREKVEAYFDFVNTFDLENPLASEKLKDAIRYSRNQEECLCRFLCDGNIPLDDGATERNIRPVAQGRRNYLFSNTISGAEATVIASTLLETAKANDAEPYFYMKYLLEQMSQHLYNKGNGHLPDMMPWSDAYRNYENIQKQSLADRMAPPGNEKPRTPRKRDPVIRTA